MKNIYKLIIVLVFVTNAASAQQVPLFSHNYYKPFLYNPSYAGTSGYTSIFAFSRTQFTDLSGNAKTAALTIDGALKPNKAGLGGLLQYDQIGEFTIINANGAYSYRVDLNEKSRLVFGLAAGIYSNRINFTDVVVRDAQDPDLYANAKNATTFDVNYGMHYVLKDWTIGLAFPQLLSNKSTYADNNQSLIYRMSRHYMLNTDYNIKINENTRIVPMAIMRFQPNAPFQYDLNAVAYFKQDKLWAGAMYRSGYAVTPMVGAKLHNQLVLGYAYDYAINGAYNSRVGQTHEVMLGYIFKSKAEKEEDEFEKRLKKLEKDNDSLKTVLADHEKRIDSLESHEDDIASMRHTLADFKRLMATEEGRHQVLVGDQYILKTVYFDTKQEVRGSVNEELNELALILIENKNMHIQLTGHTDDVGSDDYNNVLSLHRAEWAMKYLIERGVEQSRLTAKGFGKKQPIVSNRTEKGRALNRRVEFIVTQK